MLFVGCSLQGAVRQAQVMPAWPQVAIAHSQATNAQAQVPLAQAQAQAELV